MDKKRAYQLSASVNEGITEVVISGEVTKDTADEVQQEVLAIARSTKARALIVDVRALKGRLGSGDTYFRVRSYVANDEPSLPTAVVDLPENAKFESFHETTAANAGVTLKAFTDLDAARAWLKSRQVRDGGPGRDRL
jgi:hypothetical protein